MKFFQIKLPIIKIKVFVRKIKSKSLDDSLTINADDFKYEKLLNILTADKNVFIQDDIEDYKIIQFIKYFKTMKIYN